MIDPSFADPGRGAPVPPPPASPGSGGISRAWLLAGGVGCGCIGSLSLCAIIALFTLVIGPAVRSRPVEVVAAPATAVPTQRLEPTPVPTARLDPTPDPPRLPTSTLAPTSTLVPQTATPADRLLPRAPTAQTAAPRAATTPVPRARVAPLPEPVESVRVGGAQIGVLGLARLDAEGRLFAESLGETTFPSDQRGLGAAFTLEQADPSGSLTVAGVWVVRQGERVTPLADPATLDLSVTDEGQPLIFRLTFRTGTIPPGDYAFGLFTVANGQIDQLVKRLDFAVE